MHRIVKPIGKRIGFRIGFFVPVGPVAHGCRQQISGHALVGCFEDGVGGSKGFSGLEPISSGSGGGGSMNRLKMSMLLA